MIGTLAGGGANGRPFMSAGGKWRKFRAEEENIQLSEVLPRLHTFNIGGRHDTFDKAYSIT